MKRRVRLIVVFLLLGAIVNVAVAWTESFYLHYQQTHSVVGLTTLPIIDPRFCLRQDYSEFSAEPLDLDLRLPMRRGLPCESTVSFCFRRYGDELVRESAVWNTGFRVSGVDSGSAGEVVLPICPVWPGFAINTLFYAAILWLLFAASFALRRRRRINRGLCPACAYPIGASDICTECGAAVEPGARS